MGEFEIIARYFTRPVHRGDVLLGIGDDAAVLDIAPGHKLVVAMDTIVEGVHFLPGTSAADIGYRALAVNLSDLAAMGAKPAWMTLSVSLPEADEGWLEGFSAGLFELAQRHAVALVGGDTVRGPRVVTVQVAGWVEADGWLSRAGACPGDLLMLSGVPGEAAGGLAAMQQRLEGEAAARLQQRFLRPVPRIALGRLLRGIASAAMDVSDGVLADLRKLCAASACAAYVDVDALPRSTALETLFPPDACLRHALAGGDDYELLFTVPASRLAALEAALAAVPAAAASSAGETLPQVRRIGVMCAGQGVQCLRQGQPFELPSSGDQRRQDDRPQGGYDHFAAP
ncbi:hypothetical protein ACG33_10475 [Steroidobacter denitrificans]|uniref:Thiamine-monophosphate kinase n=1 Tax=Steroidobacter denitrificans TaxID=465721 RepID=A0A127FD39_STEDE|nr:thiamine-phosphate kinase [Steroidobacter denitrificans]AMN47515.1 hypothetical protein ACG33_10475 [Steroidobacter denitrificans]